MVWKNNNFILQFTFATCRCDTVMPYIYILYIYTTKSLQCAFFSQLPCIAFSLFRRILRSMNRTSWEPNFHSVAFHITPPICCSQILAALRCAFVTLVQRDQSEFKALFWEERETFCGLLNYSPFCASYQCDPQLFDSWRKKGSIPSMK